jgi:putative endonuclease
MTRLTRAELGALGENLAAEHLRSLGMRIVQRNWRCRYGELDLIAEESADTVVFVEVKTRAGDGFGGLEEAVSAQKVGRIRKLASLWLNQQSERWRQLRIDVVRIRVGRDRTPQLTHIKGVG